MYARFLRWLILSFCMTLMLTDPIGAFPSLPFSPYGTVKLNNADAPVGTAVGAWCGGIQVRATSIREEEAASWYANLDVPGDDETTPGVREGCRPYETVTLKVGDGWASQSCLWQPGGPRVDLIADSTPKAPPSPPPVVVTRTGTTLQFRWPDNTANRFYEVWRGTEPYFGPNTGGAEVIANEPSRNCINAGGLITCSDPTLSIGTNRFYFVRAGNGTDVTADSNVVGVFVFALTPGN